MGKRILSLCVAFVLCVFILPFPTLAGGQDDALATLQAASDRGDNYPYADKVYGRYSPLYDVDPWNFYYRECTSFVAWCLNSRNGVAFHNTMGGMRWGHAKDWGATAQALGYAVNNSPAVGSVAWSNVGEHGHVAWVSAVSGNQVTIEEYNYSNNGRFNSRIVSVSAFTGYIHIGDIIASANVDRGQDGLYVTGENVTMSVNTSLSTYILHIVHTPPGGTTYIYWEGQIYSSQYVMQFSQPGYYACTFYANGIKADANASQWVGWSVIEQPRASVDRGQDGIYNVGEDVIMSVNAFNFDSCILRVYRTPSGGETSLWWEGELFTNQKSLYLSKAGYYSCVFVINRGGRQIESAWVGWIVNVREIEPVYVVTFVSNDGTGAIAIQDVTDGDSIVLPACAFTAPSGKQFKTWRIGDSEYSPGSSYTVTGNTSVLAIWENVPIYNSPQITVSRNGNTVTVNVVCSDSNASVFCGVYNNSGKMIAVRSVQVTSESSCQFQFDGQRFDYAKVFIVDSNFCPLCEAKRT